MVKLDKRGCLAIWAYGANGSGQMSDVKKRHAEALRLVQNKTQYSAKLQACQLLDHQKGLSSQVKAFRVLHSFNNIRGREWHLAKGMTRYWTPNRVVRVQDTFPRDASRLNSRACSFKEYKVLPLQVVLSSSRYHSLDFGWEEHSRHVRYFLRVVTH